MTIGKSKNQTEVFWLVIITGLIFLSWSGSVWAADLQLISSKNNYQVGESFAVTVRLLTPKEAVNAVQGVVNFSPDFLQVLSIAKVGSVFDLWVQEPTFSNMTGQVVFEGAILNPGFSGPAGQLLVINFRAKKAGSADLSFSGGSVLANDGQGTDILKKLGSTSILIEPSTVIMTPPSIPVKIIKAPEKTIPKIFQPLDQSPLLDWGNLLITLLSVMIPLIGLILVFLILLLAGWRRIILFKRSLRREVTEAELKLRETFEKISVSLSEQQAMLEGAKKRRPLTTLENKLLRLIKNDLSEAEKLLKKEIDDITKQLK